MVVVEEEEEGRFLVLVALMVCAYMRSVCVCVCVCAEVCGCVGGWMCGWMHWLVVYIVRRCSACYL